MDAEAYPQEVLAEDEPRYLRRQRPLEIKRKKFGRQAWKTYLRISAGALGAALGAWVCYSAAQFLRHASAMALLRPDQVVVSGNHFTTRASILEIFLPDRKKSVLRIPLNERRRQIESLAWVEQAVVRRALPNRIEVDVTERTPIAFLRQGGDLMLVDAHGYLLDRPLEGDFHFPVVAGITAQMPPEERERRMQLFCGFLQQIDGARAGSSDDVSEVDLSEAHDLFATFSSLPAVAGPGGARNRNDAPLLVHFGDSDFQSKYQTLLQNIGQWRAAAGRVESVDLRFNREVVVNLERGSGAAGTHPASAKAAPTPPLANQPPPARVSRRTPKRTP